MSDRDVWVTGIRGLIGLAALALTLGIKHCPSREEFRAAPQVTQLSAPIERPIPAGWAGEHTAIGDMTCDGIADLVAFTDVEFIGQSWVARVIPGVRDDTGIVSFTGAPYETPLPLTMVSGDMRAILLADVDGDRCADLLFTHYRNNSWGSDETFVRAARNTGLGRAFAALPDQRTPIKGAFDSCVYSTEHHKVRDSLTMAWGDVDGDGRDDLLLYCDDENDLLVRAHRSVTNDGAWSITPAPAETTIPRFLRRRNIGDVRTGDFDGDGKADIAVVDQSGMRISIARAVNVSPPIGYVPQREEGGLDMKQSTFGPDLLGFFDANGDGQDDYVHLGSVGRTPKALYHCSRFVDTTAPAEAAPQDMKR